MDSGDAHLRNAVLNALVRGERIFLSGGAGSGKTYFVRQLARNLAAQKITTAVTASTGLGATLLFDQLEGADRVYLRGPSTIFSMAMLPWSENADSAKFIRIGQQKLMDARVLIVDEISMIAPETFDQLQLRIREGMGVLVVGDLYQLPPVDKKNSAEAPTVFRSQAFSSFSLVELTGNHRQDEPEFIGFLDELRLGILRRDFLAALPETFDPRFPILFGTRLEAETHNKKCIEEIHGPLLVSEARVVFGEREDALKWFETSVRAMIRFEFKRQMRVMCVKNLADSEKLLVANGDIGTIKSIGDARSGNPPEWLEIKFDRLSSAVRVRRAKFKKTEVRDETERTIFEVEQFPLMPAYGLTVHKAQGLTLDVANVDGARVNFAEGQAYVALSRCRTKSGLRVRHANSLATFARPLVEEYYRDAPRFEVPSMTPGESAVPVHSLTEDTPPPRPESPPLAVLVRLQRRSFARRLWDAFVGRR